MIFTYPEEIRYGRIIYLAVCCPILGKEVFLTDFGAYYRSDKEKCANFSVYYKKFTTKADVNKAFAGLRRRTKERFRYVYDNEENEWIEFLQRNDWRLLRQ